TLDQAQLLVLSNLPHASDRRCAARQTQACSHLSLFRHEAQAHSASVRLNSIAGIPANLTAPFESPRDPPAGLAATRRPPKPPPGTPAIALEAAKNPPV